jgi:capsular polysaccharide synthesis protein
MNAKKRLNEFFTLKNTFGYSFALKCYFLRIKSFAEYEQFVFDFLEKEFANLIQKYEKLPDKVEQNSESSHIWTLWWQGLDQAPEIVKTCLKSQQKNMVGEKFQYTIITKDNWQQYMELPDHIIEKVENGKITLTHFSDIIRAELLKQYGGIWIDATVFCNKKMDLKPVTELFTAKCSPTPRSLTLGRWTGFLIGDKQGSKLFSFMSEAFSQYWEKYDSLVAYLLIDYIIAIACKHFPEIRKEYDQIPVNQTGLWRMLREMNKPYDKNKWNQAIQTADFWKLSYKDEFNGGLLKEKTEQGELTNWGYLAKEAECERNGED